MLFHPASTASPRMTARPSAFLHSQSKTYICTYKRKEKFKKDSSLLSLPFDFLDELPVFLDLLLLVHLI
jgi:hypothetical protein